VVEDAVAGGVGHGGKVTPAGLGKSAGGPRILAPMDEGSGQKGCGALVAGVFAAAAAVLSQVGDDCGRAAFRAGSHADLAAGTADDAFRGARFGGAAARDEGVAVGRYRLRGGASGSADDLAAMGLVVGDEAAHSRSLAGQLIEEAAPDVVFEAIEWSVFGEEEEETEGGAYDDAPEGARGDGTPPGASVDRNVNALLDRVLVHEPRLVVWLPASSSLRGADIATDHVRPLPASAIGTAAALDGLANMNNAAPLGIAGISRDGGTTLVIGPGATDTVAVADVHRRCWERGQPCLVLACTVADAAQDDACLREASHIFDRAASQTRYAVTLQSQLLRRIFAERRWSSASTEIVISRIDLGMIARESPQGTPRMIVSRQE
jgi:hypothetical protein